MIDTETAMACGVFARLAGRRSDDEQRNHQQNVNNLDREGNL